MSPTVEAPDLQACPPGVRAPLDRVLAGRALDRASAYRLMRADAHELPAIIAAAGELRDRGKGRTVTYSRKVFIPLTNLCRDKCGYCTFAKAPGHPDARTLDPEDVLQIAGAGRDRGCKEALFSLGERPEERYAIARDALRRLGYRSTVDYLGAMCHLVADETGLIPHTNAGVMGRDELMALREVNGSMGLMLESVSERLMEQGQAHFGCVGKAPRVRLDMIAAAGDLEIAFTTGILIGIGETLEERVDSLFAIRELHASYGHIQEVIIQNFRVKPTIRMRRWPEPSALDMARTIAVARLILGPDMNIQSPPNLFLEGETSDLSSYLRAGINDWGGISPVTIDHINPECAWPAIAHLRDTTKEAGFDLRERLCIYPEYLRRPSFVPPRFRSQIESWAGIDGLVRDEEPWWS
ncbi:MAG TPA: 7,8-didemethyl-8-hydroxy-5-deazariboflavin synthase CofG [Chloroflexota bacterium]|nr:7,8-didemethyl-8-hydroxy-5-deazariboflavin synthase CofG [Chloroflexota bacterium]